jgi:glycine/D-amino acid oxidase-like deaminating enzyme
VNRRLGRREFLIGLIGACSAGLSRSASSGASPLKVGVVGGGIVGASIALHLARAGARVTLFEKLAPARGATQNSFAWVNAFVDDPHYRALRMRSLLAYRELDKTLSLNMVWGGYLDWAGNAAEADVVRSNARQLADTRYPARTITADGFAKLDPNVAPGSIVDTIYSSITRCERAARCSFRAR